MLPIRDNVPTRRFPVVTVAIIVANLAVWVLYEMQDLNRAILDFGYFPCEPVGDCSAPGGTWWTDVFTSMFMHGGWEHILGNMLFLWIFGNNVEDTLGRPRFVAFYFAGGAFATLSQTIVTLQAGSPEAAGYISRSALTGRRLPSEKLLAGFAAACGAGRRPPGHCSLPARGSWPGLRFPAHPQSAWGRGSWGSVAAWRRAAGAPR